MADFVKEIQQNKNWITNKITSEFVTFADKFGKHLAENGMTSAQIRKIYSEVKRIESQKDFPSTDFILLKPKIAYAAKKKGSQIIEDFKKVMDEVHNLVDVKLFDSEKEEDKLKASIQFQNFCHFFEAIVAYHKVYYKGKD